MLWCFIEYKMQTNFLKCYDRVEKALEWNIEDVVLSYEIKAKCFWLSMYILVENRFARLRDVYCIPADSKNTLQNNMIGQHLIKFTKTPIMARNVSFTLAK